MGAFGSNVTCLPKRSKSTLVVKVRYETQQSTNVFAAANDSAGKKKWITRCPVYGGNVPQYELMPKKIIRVISAESENAEKWYCTRDEGKAVTQHEKLKIYA